MNLARDRNTSAMMPTPVITILLVANTCVLCDMTEAMTGFASCAP